MIRAYFFILALLFALAIEVKANNTTHRYFLDFRINGFYQFEGIAEIDKALAGNVICFKFKYRGDTLDEIVYGKGRQNFSFASGGTSKYKFEYPEENQLVCTFFNTDGLRTTKNGIAKWVIEYDKLFIRKYHYDAEDILTQDENGIFQYSYKLNDDGTIKLRHGKDKLYKTILDNAGVYETLYLHDEAGNQIKKINRNKDGSYFYNQDNGYAIKYMDYDSNRNVIETRYYDEFERPTINPNCNCFAKKSLYNKDGIVLEKQFYDTDYELTFDKDYYAAIIQFTVNDYLQTTSHLYLDTAAKPTPRKGFGFAKVEIEYDEKGREIEKRYYDINFQLVDIEHGYAIEIFEYDDVNRVEIDYKKDAQGKIVPYNKSVGFKKLASRHGQDGMPLNEYYLDENDNPVPQSPQENYSIKKRFNENGLISSYTFCDVNGKPIMIDGGYAHISYSYDQFGYMEKQKLFDDKMQLVNAEEGFALVSHRYNSVGEKLSESYFDSNYEPVNLGGNGYHMYKLSGYQEGDIYYDVLEFFGIDEQLMLSDKNSYAKRIYKYDRRGNLLEEKYEDHEGNLIVPFNNTYARKVLDYDDDFQLRKTSYFNHLNEMVKYADDSTAYAKIIYSYDKNGHWYRQQTYDPSGNRLNESYKPKDGNIFGIHSFRLLRVQQFVLVSFILVVIVYFIVRSYAKKLVKNRTAINYLLWLGLFQMILGLTCMNDKGGIHEQFLAFFVIDIFAIQILLLSIFKRRLVAFLMLFVCLVGIIANYSYTLNNFYLFRYWWIVIFTPQLSTIIYLILSERLARWKKMLFPIIAMASISIVVLYVKYPLHGEQWKSWEDGSVANGDFLGTATQGSNYTATINSGVFLEYDCDESDFKFESSARMNRFTSWKVKDLSDYLLNHEQKHFDIAKIHAELLSVKLNEIENPCEISKQELDDKIDAIKQDVAQSLSEMQHRYDLETEHSLLAVHQQKWDEYLEQELNRLKNLAANRIHN